MGELDIKPITYVTAQRENASHVFDRLGIGKEKFNYFYADVSRNNMLCVCYEGFELNDCDGETEKRSRSYYLHPSANEWYEFSEDEEFEIESYFALELPQVKKQIKSFDYKVIDVKTAKQNCPGALDKITTFGKNRLTYLDVKIDDEDLLCIFYEGLPLFDYTQDTTSSELRAYYFNKIWHSLEYEQIVWLSNSLKSFKQMQTIETKSQDVHQKVTIEELVSSLTLEEWSKLTSATRIAIIEKFFSK